MSAELTRTIGRRAGACRRAKGISTGRACDCRLRGSAPKLESVELPVVNSAIAGNAPLGEGVERLAAHTAVGVRDAVEVALDAGQEGIARRLRLHRVNHQRRPATSPSPSLNFSHQIICHKTNGQGTLRSAELWIDARGVRGSVRWPPSAEHPCA